MKGTRKKMSKKESLSRELTRKTDTKYTGLLLTQVAQQLQQGGIYQISGKFTPAKDNSLNVTITTSIQLHIDEEHAPISKPIVHLIGNTTSYADITKAGYTLPIQV